MVKEASIQVLLYVDFDNVLYEIYIYIYKRYRQYTEFMMKATRRYNVW